MERSCNACWERGEPEPAGRLMAQLTNLFPLPGKHTLEREEQEQERRGNFSNEELPGEVLGQRVAQKLHHLLSFVITLYSPL